MCTSASHHPRRFLAFVKKHPDLAAQARFEWFWVARISRPEGFAHLGAHEMLAEAREETLAWVKTLEPGNGLRLWVEAALLQERAATDPEAALAEWQAAVEGATPGSRPDGSESPPDARALYRFTIVPSLPRLMEWDWQRVAAVFQGVDLPEEDVFLRAVRPVLREKAVRDPGAVVEWLHLVNANDPWRAERMLQELSHEFLVAEPEAALRLGAELRFERGSVSLPVLPPEKIPSIMEAARTARSSAYRDSVVDACLDRWHAEDPAAARAWADALPDGEFRRQTDSFFRHVSSSPAVRLYAGALESVRDHPTDESRVNRLAEMVRKIAWEHPAQVMAETGALPASPVRRIVLERVAETAVFRLPAETWQWAAYFTEEAERDAVIAAITRGAASPAAVEWLPTLKAGQARDAAVATYAVSVRKEQPEAAVRWAATIGEAERRERTLGTILPEAWQHHPEVTEKALSDSALSPEELERCRSLRPTGKPEQ